VIDNSECIFIDVYSGKICCLTCGSDGFENCYNPKNKVTKPCKFKIERHFSDFATVICEVCGSDNPDVCKSISKINHCKHREKKSIIIDQNGNFEKAVCLTCNKIIKGIE
jgi:hypothetical protein